MQLEASVLPKLAYFATLCTKT